MEELYFTIAGCSHYFGSDFMEKGMKVKLEKEPDNEYDKEAIQVKIKGLGKIGYVANSPFTVKGESMSAGRLYDKIGAFCSPLNQEKRGQIFACFRGKL